jgi:hypothetical protein
MEGSRSSVRVALASVGAVAILVLATDLAGNAQRRAGANSLIVR